MVRFLFVHWGVVRWVFGPVLFFGTNALGFAVVRTVNMRWGRKLTPERQRRVFLKGCWSACRMSGMYWLMLLVLDLVHGR